MTIYIHNAQNKAPVNQRLIKNVLRNVLKSEGYPQADLSLTLVNNHKIKSFNKQYLGRNRITDVLSFSLLSKEDCSGDHLIGEIIVSGEQAKKEARQRQIPIQQELLLYCVHGLLHLLGYDDLKGKHRKIMENREEKILKRALPTLYHSGSRKIGRRI